MEIQVFKFMWLALTKPLPGIDMLSLPMSLRLREKRLWRRITIEKDANMYMIQ